MSEELVSPVAQVFANLENCDQSINVHVLECGHEVEPSSKKKRGCGINCKEPVLGKPFACPECIVKVTRIRMRDAGLDPENPENNASALVRKEKIQKIASDALKELVGRKHRMVKVGRNGTIPKCHFFHYLLRAEGFEVVEADKDKELSPLIQYKHPDTGPRAATTAIWQLHPHAETVYLKENKGDPIYLADFWDDWEVEHLQTESEEVPPAKGDTTNSMEEQMREFGIGVSGDDEVARAVREAFWYHVIYSQAT